MLVGYARTSTLEQKAGFEAQLRELQNLGCEKIFRSRSQAWLSVPNCTARWN
jgi:DNA invertase Pin-like site-specific DNA recombinase